MGRNAFLGLNRTKSEPRGGRDDALLKFEALVLADSRCRNRQVLGTAAVDDGAQRQVASAIAAELVCRHDRDGSAF